jgi:hypothetical protein
MDQTSPEAPVEQVPPSSNASQGNSQRVLTLKEKYFQVEPEGRIRRYQYFVRSLVPAILFFLIVGIGGMFVLPFLLML